MKTSTIDPFIGFHEIDIAISVKNQEKLILVNSFEEHEDEIVFSYPKGRKIYCIKKQNIEYISIRYNLDEIQRITLEED